MLRSRFSSLGCSFAIALFVPWAVSADGSIASRPAFPSAPPVRRVVADPAGPILTASAADPVAAATVLTLDDCIRIARERQPTIAAAHQTLQSTLHGQRGLQEVRAPNFLVPELPYRRQQSALAVQVATAGVAQAERETDAAVARLYYSVIYARIQREVADGVVKQLEAAVGLGETLVGNQAAPPDLTPIAVRRGKVFLQLARTKQDEAARGLSLAEAALREAMGIDPRSQFALADVALPEVVGGVTREQVLALVENRAEVAQASLAAAIARLEICAQDKIRSPKAQTFASGGDIHAKPIPPGSFGDSYKPGALGPEYPTMLAGPKEDRVNRARALAGRANSVVDKARNLVALDGQDAFFKWQNASARVEKLHDAYIDADKLAKDVMKLLRDGSLPSFRDGLELVVTAAQIRGQYNEALYDHAVALAELERATGGALQARRLPVVVRPEKTDKSEKKPDSK